MMDKDLSKKIEELSHKELIEFTKIIIDIESHQNIKDKEKNAKQFDKVMKKQTPEVRKLVIKYMLDKILDTIKNHKN